MRVTGTSIKNYVGSALGLREWRTVSAPALGRSVAFSRGFKYRMRRRPICPTICSSPRRWSLAARQVPGSSF